MRLNGARNNSPGRMKRPDARASRREVSRRAMALDHRSSRRRPLAHRPDTRPQPRGKVVVQFVVPVDDRAGRPYVRDVFARVERRLAEVFGGWSLVNREGPFPGGWRAPDGTPEGDHCWRYEVGLALERLGEFDGFLRDLAQRLGQTAVWRIAYLGGEGRLIYADEDRGRPRGADLAAGETRPAAAPSTARAAS